MKNFAIIAMISTVLITSAAQANEITKHTIGLTAEVTPFCTTGTITADGDFSSNPTSTGSIFTIQTDHGQTKNSGGKITFNGISCNSSIQVGISGTGFLTRSGGAAGELISEIPYGVKFKADEVEETDIILDGTTKVPTTFNPGMGIGFSLEVIVTESDNLLASGNYSGTIEIAISSI